jgi:hypothetical protein
VSILYGNAYDLCLYKRKIIGVFKQVLHILLISAPISLHPQRMDGGAFACVEHAALEHDSVRGSAHFAAECVDFEHQMPFSGAADGRVAGHIADKVEREREKRGLLPCPCRGERRFYAGMSRADDDNIVYFSCVNCIAH